MLPPDWLHALSCRHGTLARRVIGEAQTERDLGRHFGAGLYAAEVDYLVAHECAHLIEANHGPRFWALCEELAGDPAPHRAWLRAHAAELHAISA